MTHTYVTMEVSRATFEEIAAKLREAGYDHALSENEIDMHGLALIPEFVKEIDVKALRVQEPACSETCAIDCCGCERGRDTLDLSFVWNNPRAHDDRDHGC